MYDYPQEATSHYECVIERPAGGLITSVAEAMKVLPYDEESLKGLLLIDRGEPGSNMTTLGLQQVVKAAYTYVITSGGLECSLHEPGRDLEAITADGVRNVEVPAYVEFEADWVAGSFTSGDGNNILGDNGRLYLQQRNLTVPVVQATDERLAYYGATLLKQGDHVRFSNDFYPIFKMNVGADYVRDFILTEEGGGHYLEFHHDQPHFHMPARGGGHYLLARWNDAGSMLQMTAFEIPDGQAVYTRKGAIHSDATLTGDLIVGYNLSDNASTVLLRYWEDDTMVDMEFVP